MFDSGNMSDGLFSGPHLWGNAGGGSESVTSIKMCLPKTLVKKKKEKKNHLQLIKKFECFSMVKMKTCLSL